MHQAPGRNVLQSNHRRLRRARRLRRIYEGLYINFTKKADKFLLNLIMIFLALSESSSSDVEEGPIDNTVGEATGGEDVSFESLLDNAPNYLVRGVLSKREMSIRLKICHLP